VCEGCGVFLFLFSHTIKTFVGIEVDAGRTIINMKDMDKDYFVQPRYGEQRVLPMNPYGCSKGAIRRGGGYVHTPTC